MTAIVYLDQQVRIACPRATGVSIGRWDDKSSWRVFSDDPNEKVAAQAIFASFDKQVWDAAQPVEKSDRERLAELEAQIAALTLKVDAK